jgi:hypothetical protein
MTQEVHRKGRTMKFTITNSVVAVPLTVAGLAALTLGLSTGVASVSASSPRNRDLRVTKECSSYTGTAGAFCTITSSNVAEIKVGSKVLYDQAAGIPAGLLDSNVVLDAGNGNRALGRCTLVFATGRGLCTFSDGMGLFAGFHARIDVSSLGAPNWAWDGTYGFTETDRDGSDRDR